MAAAALKAVIAVGKVGVFVPLLARTPIASGDLYESPVRQEILRIVEEKPGICMGELMERLSIGWGATYHHIHKLSRAGLLEIRSGGRRRLLFLAGKSDEAEALGRSLLRGATARRVAYAIINHPHASVGDLIEPVGASPRVVYYHLKRLIDAGLIRSSSPTRLFDLTPGERLEELLRKTEESLATEEPVVEVPVEDVDAVEPAPAPRDPLA